mmetsp:Transcript_11885/g.13634  ORF Transcript_11885/g.13634 Transcript_11885/m.13634 type:complete len:205 (+) Transcript_11885:108-722(+)|eukprot:CAMPEP_0194140096 /NCGR_PEP_ID=MMETSP0152-20130528/9703_1 /TAXON_ID=1049557 /ORGANISM="Thalassiothrix antarctica, Strain L6-D1" /LENGTH=204 /DNA_ID=CAMNT_0038838215 /DNA_START=36 /DNA_END=650 /DNA_ORIENTATION=+
MSCGKSKNVDVETPSDKPAVVFVLGGPGSGKGTNCERIVSDFGYQHLSTGDLLREESAKGGELGDKLKAVMEAGELVPSALLVELLKKAMKDRGWEKSRFLIDGFPRSQENADEWETQIGDEAHIRFVLFFDLSQEVMKERLLKRGQDSGRADDNEETIVKRFKTFEEQSIPVVNNYKKKGLVRNIESGREVDTVYSDVKKLFA